jgi:hypothetical protein
VPKAFKFAIDIDPQYYAAIGEVAARWSWLEHRLTVLIREGFKLDKAAGRAVMANMNASTLLRTTHMLTKFPNWISDDGLRVELAQFARDVEAQRDTRNSYVHGVYGPETTTTSPLYRIQMRNGDQILAPDGKAVTLEELQKVAQNLRALQVQGNDLSNRLKKTQRK